VVEAMKDPDVQQKLADLGVEIGPDTPDEFSPISSPRFQNGRR